LKEFGTDICHSDINGDMSSSKSYFLELPPELRLLIYRHCFDSSLNGPTCYIFLRDQCDCALVHHSQRQESEAQTTALLRVCELVHEEAYQCLWAASTLHFFTSFTDIITSTENETLSLEWSRWPSITRDKIKSMLPWVRSVTIGLRFLHVRSIIDHSTSNVVFDKIAADFDGFREVDMLRLHCSANRDITSGEMADVKQKALGGDLGRFVASLSCPKSSLKITWDDRY
jgi:hypothetical protein